MASLAVTSMSLRVCATTNMSPRRLALTTRIVRTTRARIIRLKNDYKDLMSRIEKGLHEHHARIAEQAQNNSATARQAQAGQSAPPAALEAPFAKVNSVVAGSPADEAGLKVGDSITKFGWVDWTNHERLGRVAEAVSQNEGVSTSSVLFWQQHNLARLSAARRTRSSVPNTDNIRSPSRSKLCDPAAQAARRKLCRCSLRRGGTGVDEACWAATYYHCRRFGAVTPMDRSRNDVEVSRVAYSDKAWRWLGQWLG
jgi:hypothetical protein